MAKAVLISIRPRWVDKILIGEKTLEVRKTRPKLETPFKVYIYCTNPKNIMLWNARSYIYADDHSHNAFDRCWNGSVVGEFICNKLTNLFSNSRFWLNEDDVLQTCLSAAEIRKYADGANGLYGWHISDLVCYDKPKELTEFHTWKKCKSCSKSGYESTACIYDENCMVPVAITKAPQSWCYVEELQ